MDTEEGMDADGDVYLNITVENVSNGTGKNIQCEVGDSAVIAPGRTFS